MTSSRAAVLASLEDRRGNYYTLKSLEVSLLLAAAPAVLRLQSFATHVIIMLAF